MAFGWRFCRRRIGVGLGLGGAVLVLVGCSYYGQAIRGGLEIVCRKRSIERLLADARLDPALRERLLAVQRMRQFAVRELGLPDNASYRSYADLGRPVVSWTVTAAPARSLEPKTWCFPIAGCVSYRGYFSRPQAERFAARMAAEGFDVDVGGVRAFSTLGWLADPVLNTFLDSPDPELAGLLFHELAHQRVYVAGKTTFNESFATVVEREGVRRWLASHGGTPAVEAHRLALHWEDEVARLVRETRERLESEYHSDHSTDEVLERKAVILRESRESFGRLAEEAKRSGASLAHLEGWFDDGLNNARLVSWGAYHELVPAFEALLSREGGDLRRFYEAVRRSRGELDSGRLPASLR